MARHRTGPTMTPRPRRPAPSTPRTAAGAGAAPRGGDPDDRIVAPGMAEHLVRMPSGEQRPVPAGWAFLPAGDAFCTRRVKQGGPTWTVKVRRGRRDISLGLYADAGRIEAARAEVAARRAAPEHQERLEKDRARRAARETEYAGEFERAVTRFLDFAPMYRELAEAIAARVATHATPVGSGTVARTARIPLAQRAEAAVIAWMRHQTTAYDRMRIERVKGRRREVRRALAERSRDLLEAYRRGVEVDPAVCPLYRAVSGSASAG